MGKVWKETRLLLWRNYVLKKRHWLSTCSEVLVPLLFVWLVMYLKTLKADSEVQEQHFTCPRQTALSPSLLFPPSDKEFVMEMDTHGAGPGLTTIPPFIYLPLIASKLHSVVALAPDDENDSAKREWIQTFRDRLDDWTAAFESVPWRMASEVSHNWLGFGFCRFNKVSKIFSSAKEIENYVKSEAYGSSGWPFQDACPDAGALEHPKLNMALILNKLGTDDGKWDYTIQTNFSVIPLTYPKLGFTNKFISGVDELYIDQFMMSGFLTMQQAADRFILNTTVEHTHTNKTKALAIRQLCDNLAPMLRDLEHFLPKNDTEWPLAISPQDRASLEEMFTHPDRRITCQSLLTRVTENLKEEVMSPLVEPVRYIPNDVRMTEFPVPTHMDRSFYNIIKDVFALDLILTFLWPISRLIRGIVHEKETRLREGMRMMGLTYTALYLSWFLTYGAMFTFISTCISLMTRSDLFGRSDTSLVFLYFTLFGLSIVAYCFLISVLFSRAKTASTAGVVLFFMGFFAYFGVASENATANAKVFGAFLSPTAFGLGASLLATYEGAGTGVTWSNFHETPNASQISFFAVLGFLSIDTLIYMFLAFYLDAVLPQEFGIQRPWYFLCTRRFWCGNTASSQESEMYDRLVDEAQAHEEDDPEVRAFVEPPSVDLKQLERVGRCVKIRGLRKEFPTASGSTRVAVDKLNLTMYEGQIFVLLGHNGAGKSTTINVLTGLLGKTSGEATLYGHDTETEMNEIRKSLGVCPQHDVLFPELTVREHLEFFGGLKGVSSIDDEIEQHLVQVGLLDKQHTQAGNLSGGQKRKLSVCIALLGQSKVVFLDEPTSGMDAYSRRATWNLLQKNRAGRVIILTTHFMDEADLLGDRIAIMAEGKLKCCGSSLFLKEKYGIGYTITISLEVSLQQNHVSGVDRGLEDRKRVTKQVLDHLPEATVLSSVGAEVSFKVPFQSSPKFPGLFRSIESTKTQLRIANYGVSVTQLEEVFLKVASDEFNLHKSHRHQQQQEQGEQQEDAGVHSAYRRLDENGDSGEYVPLTESELDEMDAVYENISHSETFRVQFRALFLKRYFNAKRDGKSICCNTLLPIVLLCLGLALLKAFPLKNPPPMDLVMENFDQAVNYFPINATHPVDTNMEWADFAPVTQAVPAVIPVGMNNTCPGDAKESDIPDGSALRGMSTWLIDHRADNKTSLYGAAVYSRVNKQEGVELTIFSNSTAKQGPGVFLSLVDQGLGRWLSPFGTNMSIRVHSAPFPFTTGFVNLLNSFGSIDASMSCVIAFSFVPASVAIFIVKEKEISAKHQQLISGANISAYWLSSYLWDLIMYLLPWVVSVFLVWAFQISAFQGANLGAVAVLFLMYGVAVMPFTYCLSFLFESHSTAQNVVLLINFVTGLVLLIASTVMSAIETTMDVNATLQYVYRLFPGYCLGDGLWRITFNKAIKDFDPTDTFSRSPFAWDVAGADMVYMGATALVYLSLTILVDYILSFPWLRALGLWGCCKFAVRKLWRMCLRVRDVSQALPMATPVGMPANTEQAKVEEEEQIEDSDVLAERERIDAGHGSEDVIVVNHLRKVYPDGKVAVRGLTFGIPEGECFGFLGQNGAGKTSTIKILTGDILASSGTASLVGHDILVEQNELRRMIGYCPQFDALLENLTVREHLEMYARIKCLPESLVQRVAQEKIRELNLDDFEDKTAGTLSGGNKRKLSIAIAMVGSPPLVFCDEPTSGMDPFNRRFLWDVISRISTDSQRARKGTVVLTSHSMEECEALCSKVGILVNGQFSCFGSVQHLKSKFGKGLMVDVKLKFPDLGQAEALVSKAKDFLVQPANALPCSKIDRVCELWGCASRFEMVESSTSVLGSMLQKSEVVDAMYFAEWWLTEDSFDRVDEFFQKQFPGCELVERHHTQARYKVQVRDIPGVFAQLEASKTQLPLAQYSVSDPTLEMIFNAFAQHQEQSE